MKIEAYWDLNQLSQIKSKSQALKAFEEEFVHMFLKESRKSIQSINSTHSGFDSKMYWDMFDMQMAKAISDSDALGIKEYLAKALESYQKNSK